MHTIPCEIVVFTLFIWIDFTLTLIQDSDPYNINLLTTCTKMHIFGINGYSEIKHKHISGIQVIIIIIITRPYNMYYNICSINK